MRLTLRTLLAYVDDTLDPAQARQIGEKVAESPVAQELIDRIKKVTRKRTLMSPDATDANLVAEYLDNDLPGDKIAELEEQALHSDVLLAELAACHQVLTLIMSEPVRVPPTSRQRMYGLVKGTEVDPGRMAPRVAPATLAELELPDESEGYVLVSRRGGRSRIWAAATLALGLMITVPLAMRTRNNEPTASRESNSSEAAKLPVVPNGQLAKLDPPKSNEQSAVPAADPPKTMATPDAAIKEPEKKAPDAPPQPPAAQSPITDNKPSAERGEVGKLANAAVLLQRPVGGREWKRVPANGGINSVNEFMCLPGMTGELRLGDLTLELFGTMSDVHQSPLFESDIAPFVPAAGFAADIRLERGRIYARSNKPAGAKVRLRLGEDIYDITLADDKTEIMADRINPVEGVSFSRDFSKQKQPVAFGMIVATQGKAEVRRNLVAEGILSAGPKPIVWRWRSVGGDPGPFELPEASPTWARTPTLNGPERATAFEMEQAAKRLPRQLADATKPIYLAISELMIDASRPTRRIGLFAQAALDDLSVLDALEDATNLPTRQAAMSAVQHWLGRASNQTSALFEALVQQKRFSEGDAEAVMTLWFGFTDAEIKEPRTYAVVLDALASDKLAVREAAYWRLSTQLDPEGAKLFRFVSTDSAEMRQKAVQEWKRRIPSGQLPPGRPN